MASMLVHPSAVSIMLYSPLGYNVQCALQSAASQCSAGLHHTAIVHIHACILGMLLRVHLISVLALGADVGSMHLLKYCEMALALALGSAIGWRKLQQLFTVCPLQPVSNLLVLL